MIDTEQEVTELAMRLPTLQVFAEVGQDKAAVARLYDMLLEDIRPGNLIERLWIRDIAVLTVRSEELRLVQLAVHKALMTRTESAFGALPGVIGDGQGQSAAAEEAVQDPPVGGTFCAKLAERAVGLTYAEHLAVLSGLAEMESDVRKDRDRILEQMGHRRMSTVRDVLEMVLDGLEARRG